MNQRCIEQWNLPINSFVEIREPSAVDRKEIRNLGFEVVLVEGKDGRWYGGRGFNTKVGLNFEALRGIEPKRIIHNHPPEAGDEKNRMFQMWRNIPSPEDVMLAADVVNKVRPDIRFEILGAYGTTAFSFGSVPTMENSANWGWEFLMLENTVKAKKPEELKIKIEDFYKKIGIDLKIEEWPKESKSLWPPWRK